MADQYTEIKFPKTRIATLDICEIGLKRHYVKGLVELDVTKARQLIREYREKNHTALSFLAWLIKTISTTLSEHQQAHAYLRGKRKALVFDDIDVAITIEVQYDGVFVPLPYVIRRTNHKSLTEISEEIERVKNQPVTKKDMVLGQQDKSFSSSIYYLLPGFLRKWIWKVFLLNPKTAHKNMGSVVITSVGMMGNISGWFIPISVHPLSFGVGAIKKKPAVMKDQIVIREFLHLTILMDHDVIDGAPTVRFISKLGKQLESGFGLTESGS